MAQLERPQSQSQRYAETSKIPQLERPHSARNADPLKAAPTIHTMEQLLRAGEASKSKHSPIYSPSSTSSSSPSTPFFQRLRHHDQEEDHGQNQKKSVLSKVKEKAKKLRHSLSKKKHEDWNVSSPSTVPAVETDAGVEDDAEYLGAPSNKHNKMYESEKAPAGYKETARQQHPRGNPVTPEKLVMSSNDKHVVEQDHEKSLNRSLSKRTQYPTTRTTPTSPTTPTATTTTNNNNNTTTNLSSPNKTSTTLSSSNKTSASLSSPNKTSTTPSSPNKASTTLTSPNKASTTLTSSNKSSTTLSSPNKTSTTLSSTNKASTTLSSPNKASTTLSSSSKETTLSNPNETITTLSNPNKTITTLSNPSKPSTTPSSPNKTNTKTVAEKLKPVYVGGSDAASSITSKTEGLTVSKPTEHQQNHASSSTVTPTKSNKTSLPLAASRTPPAKVPSQSSSPSTMRTASSAPVTPAPSGKNTSPTGQIWDKGVSVKEYLMNKLEPGEDEKALSQVISEAMSPRRTPGDAGVMEKVREAVTSLLRNEEPTKYAETTSPTTRMSSQIPASTNTPRASSQIPVSSDAQEVVQEENHGRILQAN